MIECIRHLYWSCLQNWDFLCRLLGWKSQIRVLDRLKHLHDSYLILLGCVDDVNHLVMAKICRKLNRQPM